RLPRRSSTRSARLASPGTVRAEPRPGSAFSASGVASGRLPRPTVGAQELCRRYSQALRQAHDHVQRGVPTAALDPADVGPIHPDVVREALLRAGLLAGRAPRMHPQFAHSQAEADAMLTALHAP